MKLTWNAIPLSVAVDTAPQSFGDVPVGATATATRLIRNNTSRAIDISTTLQLGTAPDCSGHFPTPLCTSEIQQGIQSYALDDSGCHPIPALGSCTLTIALTPRSDSTMEPLVQVASLSDADVITQSLPVSGTGVPPETMPGTTLAVEYLNGSLGHYFMTSDPSEQALLDHGELVGWQRTGRSFRVFAAADGRASGANPVCRFYGRPEAGLDSHFYSASPDECAAVVLRFSAAWLLESNDVFEVRLPDTATGACPQGWSPVYRVYNQRPDANHRYTTHRDVRDSMIAVGWIAEGYGSDAVTMCAPQ